MPLWLPTSLAILDFAFALCGYSSSEKDKITPTKFQVRITWIQLVFDVACSWF